MKKSLKRKWTAFMMLLVLAVLSIVGVFLLSSTINYYINQFRSEVGVVFTTDLLEELNANATGIEDSAAAQVASTVEAYSGTLGIGSGREYYILDAQTGDCLATSEVNFDGSVSLTGNMTTAMNGEVGERISMFGKTMDLAIPVNGDVDLVIDITDDRSDMRHMCWLMFLVIMAAVVIGLAASAGLSMALIRTVTDPISELNEGAKRITGGDYEQVLLVHDMDEIGELTQSFNEMSAVLRRTMKLSKLESARLKMMAEYLSEGYLELNATGEIRYMNRTAQAMLGMSFAGSAAFSEVFPGLPFPDAEEGAVQISFVSGGNKLRAVFVADENRGFTALVLPMEENA